MNWTMVILKLRDEADQIYKKAETDPLELRLVGLTVGMILANLAKAFEEGTRIE